MIHHTITFKGKIINYQDEGKGEQTLVLLHGFMNDLRVWQDYVLSYMNSIRVIAIDLIGHGESEVVDEVSTMEEQADMVKEVLDKCEVKHCVMCGHSMGGFITLAFAEKYPLYLKGFILMHSQAIADSDKGKENRKRACKLIDEDRIKYIVDFIPNLFAKENRTKFSSEIEDIKDMALNTSKEGIIAAQMGMLERKSRLVVLEKSEVPVLFIIGKEDPRIELETIFAQAMLPEHSETLLLGSCGHMSFIEQEDIIKRRLLDFTKSCFE
jgi:pimeloyl-ACP methyl ester carboxylesterase